MNSLERALTPEIPLGEAASYFVQLKKLAAPAYAPPDATGDLEGQFSSPLPQVLQTMVELVENEMKTMYAYTVYANSLRDLAHFAISEEFDNHAVQELEHADFLLRRLAVLGGPIQSPDIPAPPASADPVDIIKTMIRMEQEGIARWQTLHACLGDNPTKYKVEEFMTREQEHLDELWQMLPQEAHGELQQQAVQSVTGAQGAPPQAAPAQEAAVAPPAEGQKQAAATPTERAKANLETKSRMVPGMRGEAYGDVIGRLLGAGGGATVGHLYGGKGQPLAAITSAALGQHLGGKGGKAIGKEVDARRNKTAALKRAFEDPRNMLAMEQQAMAAQEQNEAKFYAEKAQQESQARQQLEQQLQQSQQDQSEKDQQLQAMQGTLQLATDSSTKAMMQSVQATQEAIQHRQLAADTTISFDKFKQQLRELADGGGSAGGPGDQTGGMAGGPGEAQQGAQGPANQAPTPGAPAASPTPGQNGPGEGPTQPAQPTEQPASVASGSQQGQGPDKPEVNVKVSSVAQGLMSAVKERAPHALAGALLGAGAQAAHQGLGRSADEMRSEIAEREANSQGGFAEAMGMAQAKFRMHMQEAAENHPEMAIGAGALMGGVLGATKGPEHAARFSKILDNVKYLRG